MKRIFLAIVLAVIPFTVFGQLYVGANYHPHDDKDMAKIQRDIDLMQEAGFTCVRLGHLAWDSYEPKEGEYDFAWFDQVMDKMAEAGIGVILDIATRPAPLWLHSKYPSIDITDENGNKLYSNHRYMEDMGDPHFQEYALRFVDVMTKRYASHPALMAFGIDNELGDGPTSYSETVRQRFIVWLHAKYGDLETLNDAWAGQRWSRKIGQWDEIGLPQSGKGAPEKKLDFRRFVSDEVNGFYEKFLTIVETNAPGVNTTSNAWYYSPLKYIDYVPMAYSGKMTRHGFGFYAGTSLTTNWGVWDNMFGVTRIQFESETPFWCTEFTTVTAVPGAIRKGAYAALLAGSQLICGWTWQSMHGGEEQYLEGMLDWDGIPNRKYDEYRQIASEFKKIEKYMPYKQDAEVALAYSFDSHMSSFAFPENHEQQLQKAFEQFMFRNMDCRMIDISRSDLDYKLLILPGYAVMTEQDAEKIRKYVADGGTVIMTSNSAVVDETGKVFASTHPGRLSDIFGVRVASFEETAVMNEISTDGSTGYQITVDFHGKPVKAESARYDVVYPVEAKVLATISSLPGNAVVMTENTYGKGRAYYIGLPSGSGIMNGLIDSLIPAIGLKPGPDVPHGVMARDIDSTHSLYLNPTGETVEIKVSGKSKGLITGKEYKGVVTIPPYEVEFIEKSR